MKTKFIRICLLFIIFLVVIGTYSIFNRKSDIYNAKFQYKTSANEIINYAGDKKLNANLLLSDDDFVIKDGNNNIELFGKYEEIITNEKIAETIESNESHAYYIFTYENFNILSDGDMIASIDLTTPLLPTARGIIIGDKIGDVLEKYGDTNLDKCEYDEEHDIPGHYMYSYNSKYITFSVDEVGIVVGITLEIF